MIREYVAGYLPSVLYVLYGTSVHFADVMDDGIKFAGLILAAMGIVHLALKIYGTWLDNRIKNKQLE